MSYWDNIFGQVATAAAGENDALRNSIFGRETAAMAMPPYDDERRLQRRMYDMPELIMPLQFQHGRPAEAAPETSPPSEGHWSLIDVMGGHESDADRSQRTRHVPKPAPGEFYFGDAADKLAADNGISDEVIQLTQALHGPTEDERSRVGFPNFGPPGWRPPMDSVLPFPSRADREEARDIAGEGALFAQPGAEVNEFGRPILRNPDQSGSTVRSIVVQDPRLNDNRPTMIPSIQEGRQLSGPQAIEYAIRSGDEYPAFENIEAAVRASQAHSQMLGQAGQAGQPVRLPPIQDTPDYIYDDLTERLMRAMLGRRRP